MKQKLTSKNTAKLIEKLCPKCYSNYVGLLKEQVADDLRWERGSQGGDHLRRPIDKAIKGKEPEYEEEIELYKTYGGD
ncbi:MAG TPA: hypothetical protein EYG21_04975 [Nitrospinaceae bacterium]|nr:hypothetical protein [Nitrospinaceae bacterium]